MKRILLIIAFLVTSAFANINWAEDIDEAYELAEKENKSVMVMLSLKGCPACKYMKNVVFEDKKFMTYFNKHFIAVHVDIHRDFIPDGLEYFATPTFYFLDANEKILYRINGSHNTREFLDELELIE